MTHRLSPKSGRNVHQMGLDKSGCLSLLGLSDCSTPFFYSLGFSVHNRSYSTLGGAPAYVTENVMGWVRSLCSLCILCKCKFKYQQAERGGSILARIGGSILLRDNVVREYAAGTFASLLEKDFNHFSKLYLQWVKTESVNVKRAIALAVKYGSKSAEPKKWKTYFDLIDPLMAEEAEYIRKNLGPFAIGDGLLSRYPDQILGSCKKWIKSDNENVRWNTAMIFTAAAARKFAKAGKPILLSLEKDTNPFVSRAAKKALKNLEKN